MNGGVYYVFPAKAAQKPNAKTKKAPAKKKQATKADPALAFAIMLVMLILFYLLFIKNS